MDEAVSTLDLEKVRSTYKSMKDIDFHSMLLLRFLNFVFQVAKEGKCIELFGNERVVIFEAFSLCFIITLMFFTDLCSRSITVAVIQDIFDIIPISQCEKCFSIVENNLPQWKSAFFFESCRNLVLRMCNDLLKRLSRTVNTSFCGQILVLLARALPLCEKSGLNLASRFNTDNITNYETVSSFASVFRTFTLLFRDIPVDYSLYVKFWQLQSFFSSPSSCYERGKWAIFQHVCMFILLQLQLNDSQFRRYFLVQCLIIYQYLLADVRSKDKSFVLNDEQIRFVVECIDRCYQLLCETHPRGEYFAHCIKVILEREKEWSEWKNKNCEDFTQFGEKERMGMFKRLIFFILDLGNPELTKLWNINPDMLNACEDEKRKFAPIVEDFIRDPLDELDPEQQVEDQYKSVNNEAFQWRATRLLMYKSPVYFQVVLLFINCSFEVNTIFMF
uniref:Death domain-containing protein n=1 Tax=Syphacia muris TaxID=451379 RepID=A0A0N5APP6_9BILA